MGPGKGGFQEQGKACQDPEFRERIAHLREKFRIANGQSKSTVIKETTGVDRGYGNNEFGFHRKRNTNPLNCFEEEERCHQSNARWCLGLWRGRGNALRSPIV